MSDHGPTGPGAGRRMNPLRPLRTIQGAAAMLLPKSTRSKRRSPGCSPSHATRTHSPASRKPQSAIAKTNLLRLEDEEAKRLLAALLDPGTCAVTNLALDFSGADPDLAPSLDRIDSNGHYEPDNVQVVAWFVNRWKSDDPQANFNRLLNLVARRAYATAPSRRSTQRTLASSTALRSRTRAA